MATVYSDEVAVGTYNRVRIKCDYSGTSATLSVEFRRTSSWTDSWYDPGATLAFNGVSKSAAYSYSGTVGTGWITLVGGISGYSVSTSGGTYDWTFSNPSGGVLGCSGKLTIPAQGSAPSGGYINNLASHWDSTNNEVVVTTTAAGVTDTGGVALVSVNWNITEQPYTMGIARISRVITNGSASALSNSLNTYTGSTISVLPNSTYYRGLYATNSVGEYRYNGGSFTTVCAPATVSLSSVTETTATLAYSTPADGGVYSKTIQYSLDGVAWATGATVSTGSASSGTFTITGLIAGTTYTLRSKVVTTAGTTVCDNSLSFTTLAVRIDPKLYMPVSNGQGGYKTSQTHTFYAAVSDGHGGYKTGLVLKMYAPVNDGGTYKNKIGYLAGTIPEPEEPNYGTIHYHKTGEAWKNYTIKTEEDFNKLGHDDYDYPYTIHFSDGVSISSTDIYEFEFGNTTPSVIPDGFLSFCENLVQISENIPDSVTTIGYTFLYGCTELSQELTIGENVTSIGEGFMGYCDNFVGPLYVNTDAAPTDEDSLATGAENCPMYEEGVELGGTYKYEWLDALPNDGTFLFRNLYVI